MKLGDNGEAFFVEETEEEYVSCRVTAHYPLVFRPVRARLCG